MEMPPPAVASPAEAESRLPRLPIRVTVPPSSSNPASSPPPHSNRIKARNVVPRRAYADGRDAFLRGSYMEACALLEPAWEQTRTAFLLRMKREQEVEERRRLFAHAPSETEEENEEDLAMNGMSPPFRGTGRRRSSCGKRSPVDDATARDLQLLGPRERAEVDLAVSTLSLMQRYTVSDSLEQMSVDHQSSELSEVRVASQASRGAPSSMCAVEEGDRDSISDDMSEPSTQAVLSLGDSPKLAFHAGFRKVAALQRAGMLKPQREERDDYRGEREERENNLPVILSLTYARLHKWHRLDAFIAEAVDLLGPVDARGVPVSLDGHDEEERWVRLMVRRAMACVFLGRQHFLRAQCYLKAAQHVRPKHRAATRGLEFLRFLSTQLNPEIVAATPGEVPSADCQGPPPELAAALAALAVAS